MDKITFEALNGEEWKPIKDFDGYYISNFGRIYSDHKKGFLSSHKDNCGYLHTTIYKSKKRYTKLVHRFVAEAFVENPNGYKEVNHKDEDKSNNRADNLEWCTRKYNILYGKAGKERYIKMGISQRYSRNDLKPVECLDAKTGEVLHRFRSIAEATRVLFGFTSGRNTIRSNIISCCRHRTHVKTAHGYKWRYADV